MAVDQGGGIYVEYTSSDFVLAILNRGCFIQYFTELNDLPPNEWVSVLYSTIAYTISTKRAVVHMYY